MVLVTHTLPPLRATRSVGRSITGEAAEWQPGSSGTITLTADPWCEAKWGFRQVGVRGTNLQGNPRARPCAEP